MFNRLMQLRSYFAAASLALLAASADAVDHGIVELGQGDDKPSLFQEYEYVVVSLYNSDEEAKRIDDLIQGAKKFFD
jgi:hypothetical protein